MKLNHQTSVMALFLVCAVVILVSPNHISSHEPVTTNIRFNKEVVRIFQRHCLACHQPGGPTNVSLDSYGNARPWARAFKEEVLEKRMPPFQAVKGFGNFHNDYALTQHEIDQIVAWVEGGVPKGDAKDLPANPKSEGGWTRGRPDLELPVKTEANSSTEIHRCIAVPTGIKRARWVSAIDFHPADAATVHCVSFAISNKPVNDSTDCESVGDSFGSWLPGQDLSDWPNGAARLLPAGSNVVMQVHYLKGSHPPAESSIGIYFARSPMPRSLRTLSIRAANETVNAGEGRHRVTATYTLNRPADVLGIRPLLFPFAKSVEVIAYRPSGLSETLVWVQDYRYDWQPEYRFKAPVTLPRGTRVEVVAYLDNSDKNSNNPSRPAMTIRFDSALCELFVVDANAVLHKK